MTKRPNSRQKRKARYKAAHPQTESQDITLDEACNFFQSVGIKVGIVDLTGVHEYVPPPVFPKRVRKAQSLWPKSKGQG